MNAFDKYLQTVFDQAVREAQADGSPAVEAHHLLLAIADGPDAVIAEILTSAGLDHTALRAALDREFEHSLSAVGVSPAAFGLPRPTRTPDRSVQLGASAKLAVERGIGAAARKDALRPAHLLLGVLQAELGTVPRALALAGVDRAALIARARPE